MGARAMTPTAGSAGGWGGVRPYVLPARTGLGERALRGRLGEARALAERDPGRGLPPTAALSGELAGLLWGRGRAREAVSALREALAAARALAAGDPLQFHAVHSVK